MPAETILGGINQEATQLELLGNISYLLAAMLEKMPRVTGNDQMAMVPEGGVVSTVSIVSTLSNLTLIGSRSGTTAMDAMVMTGVGHIYNNITVSA